MLHVGLLPKMREFPPIDREAEADAMRTLFFEDAEFEGRPCRVSRANYLAFLSMRGDDVAIEVRKLRSFFAQHSPEEMARDIVRLLKARNWRFHNIACVALASGYGSDRAIAALWGCLRAGSWTSPQLSATAAYVDSEFKEKALEAIKGHDTYFKSIVSLAGKLRNDVGAVHQEASEVDLNIQEALSIDRDNSGAIAVGWLANLRDAFGPTYSSRGSPSAPAEL